MPTTLGIVASHRTVTGPPFPLSITWHTALWAADPNWTPPPNDGGVASWRNAGTSAADATQPTGGAQPTYRAAYANLNGKPAIDFDGIADSLNAATPLINQPNHVVVVGWLDPTHAADPFICDGSTNRHMVRNHGAGKDVLLFAGGVASAAGAGRVGSFVLIALFNGASSALRVNGTSYTVPSVGGSGFSMMRIGAQDGGAAASQFYKGAIGFFAVKDDALTAQEITDLETWANNHYGVPMP